MRPGLLEVARTTQRREYHGNLGGSGKSNRASWNGTFRLGGRRFHSLRVYPRA